MLRLTQRELEIPTCAVNGRAFGADAAHRLARANRRASVTWAQRSILIGFIQKIC